MRLSRPSIVLALLITLGSTSMVRAQEPVPAAQRSEVRASGSAQRSVRPNLAVLTLEFSDVGATPSAAGANVAARAARLRSAFEALGIARDSLASTAGRWTWWRGRVEPVFGPHRCWQSAPQQPQTCAQDTAYRVHEAMHVRLRDVAKVGAVIDTALAHGIVQISAVRYTATDTDSVQAQLLREATVQAHGRAQAMAEASRVRLGRLLSLSSDGAGYRPELSVVQSAGGGVPTETIEPGIPVTMSVSGVWEVEP